MRRTVSLSLCALALAATAHATPTITKHPQHTTATYGGMVRFGVEASGSGLKFQWRKNGKPIKSAMPGDGKSLTLRRLVFADNDAQIDVVVSDGSGSVTSETATLTVLPLVDKSGHPFFSLHPMNTQAKVGDNVTLKANATGNPAPTYQWLKNGSPISGATGDTYTFAPQSDDFGAKFSVQASNSTQTNAISQAATLLQDASQAGATHTVTFQASEGGTLEGTLSQQVNSGTACTRVAAKPNLGYYVSYWALDGKPFAIGNEVEVPTVTQDMTLTAQFMPFDGGKVGQLAANLFGVDQTGQVHALSDYYGTVIVVDISTLWCGPCNQEAPKLDAWAKEQGDKIKVFTVLAQGQKSMVKANQADVQTWFSKHNITSTLIMNDALGSDGGPATTHYLREGFPTFVVIDKDFQVRFIACDSEGAKKKAIELAR